MSKWKIATLIEVANIERSGVQPEQIRDGTIYVGLENIEKGGRFIGLKPVDNGELASSKFQFNEQHILYGKLRPYLAKIACPEFSGICSTDILPILPRSNVDRKFLFHFLRQPKMVDYANSLAVGVNLPRLNPSALANFEIPIPPLEEQKRIAEILDRAQSLISKRREAIAQLDTLTQAIFLETFGDPVTNPKNIKTLPLAKVCKRITDGTHQPPKWSTSGYPFLFVSNIISGEITFDTAKFISSETHEELTRRCPIEVGDVLYSTVGSYGVPVIVKTQRKFAFQRHIAHIKPDSNLIDSQFLCAMLASPSLKRQADRSARGVAQKTVNLEEIRKFIIFCPSISLQQEFARRAEAVEKLKAAHRASLSELDALFASLQHRAFRGEL